jgi:hypothetical protein
MGRRDGPATAGRVPAPPGEASSRCPRVAAAQGPKLVGDLLENARVDGLEDLPNNLV